MIESIGIHGNDVKYNLVRKKHHIPLMINSKKNVFPFNNYHVELCS